MLRIVFIQNAFRKLVGTDALPVFLQSLMVALVSASMLIASTGQETFL